VGPPRPRPRIRPHTCTPLLSVLAWDALHPRRLRRPARSAPRLVTGSSVSSVWRVRSGSPPTALCPHHWVRIVVAHVSLQARTAREHGTPPVGRRTRGPRRHRKGVGGGTGRDPTLRDAALGHQYGLAPVGYPLSTCRLSTRWSTGGLTWLPNGGSRLGEGFPLRCFQRFARPHVATRRCPLPNNRSTSGASSPVLSY
jgi:hypothetical protein